MHQKLLGGSRPALGFRTIVGVLLLAAALASCGPPKREIKGAPAGGDTIVAATVNGKPIYIADVHSEAATRGMIREGEELDANSDQFFQLLEDPIETRLFALEAEGRRLDRNVDVRHRLERARELVLAGALNDQIREQAIDEAAIEKMYREQARLLRSGREVHLRKMVLATKDAALEAKRRLEAGESFEALAYERSVDRKTASEGGDLGFVLPETLPEGLRAAAGSTAVGQVGGPVQINEGWALLKVEERREEAPPSLEALRPRIEQWLMFEEQRKLVERLKTQAKIERFVEEDPAGAAAGAKDEGAEAPKRKRDAESKVPLGPGAVAGAAAPKSGLAPAPTPAPPAGASKAGSAAKAAPPLEAEVPPGSVIIRPKQKSAPKPEPIAPPPASEAEPAAPPPAAPSKDERET